MQLWGSLEIPYGPSIIGLSGNLWRPLETSGNLWKPLKTSENLMKPAAVIFGRVPNFFINKRNFEKKKNTAGNRPSQFREVSSRFLDKQSLTDHTVLWCMLYVFVNWNKRKEFKLATCSFYVSQTRPSFGLTQGQLQVLSLANLTRLTWFWFEFKAKETYLPFFSNYEVEREGQYRPIIHDGCN